MTKWIGCHAGFIKQSYTLHSSSFSGKGFYDALGSFHLRHSTEVVVWCDVNKFITTILSRPTEVNQGTYKWKAMKAEKRNLEERVMEPISPKSAWSAVPCKNRIKFACLHAAAARLIIKTWRSLSLINISRRIAITRLYRWLQSKLLLV